MSKQKLLALLVVICTFWNYAKAQSYSIDSFEGQNVKIRLIEKATDKSWYVAKVSCLTDSLFLVGFNGVKEVHVLSNMFLEIVYDTRGGSGYKSRNTVILSVKKNKINVAMLANSFGNAFGGDIDGSLNVVKFNITGNNKTNFKLVAHIYDRHKSGSSPKENYLRNENVILKFDSVKSIFYSTHKSIAQLFTLNDPKTQESVKQMVSGTLPIIALGQNSCYYIKGEWYKLGYNDSLFKEYYR